MAKLGVRSHGALLSQLLARPQLSSQVQQLDGERLAGLIRRVGVEDAGELLSLVSADQLTKLFDGELWRHDGDEETLDPERFALWLEVLLESGPFFAADRLAALPQELLSHALDGHLIAFDVDDLATFASIEGMDEATDKALSAPLSHELDHYLLLSRGQAGWDALLSAILALDERHPDHLRVVLDHLCRLAMQAIDDSGLFTVLNEAQALAEDALAEREERRAARGYVPPADARAFLALKDHPEQLLAHPERDALTKAYFRRLEPEPSMGRGTIDLAAELDALEVTPALPQPGTNTLADALRALHEHDSTRHTVRLEELAYLTNLLIAAAPDEQRPRPAAAAQEAMAVCGRALTWLATQGITEPLQTLPLDILYRIGRRLDERLS